MVDLLIRGMGLPKHGESGRTVILLGSCGRADVYTLDGGKLGEYLGECETIDVPGHGRLIDADALIADLQYDSELAGRALALDDFANSRERDRVQFEKDCKDNCVRFVEQSDTIIPASKEGGE